MSRPPGPSRVRFLAAEFVVIVIGVLVALFVDQLIAQRQDRVAEGEYVSRLKTDLAADTLEFAWFRGVLGQKAGFLDAVLGSDPDLLLVADPPAAMATLRYSTFIGLPAITGATFQELQSTGSLRLLQSPEVRSRLTDYYSEYHRMTTILDQRFGGYREIVFASVPGDLEYASRLDSLAVDAEALRTGLDNLVAHPGLTAAVNAELSYTAALLFYLNESSERARTLLGLLEERYPG